MELFQFETLCASNHIACRFAENVRFFRYLRAGRRCAAASRFTFVKGKTLTTRKGEGDRTPPLDMRIFFRHCRVPNRGSQLVCRMFLCGGAAGESSLCRWRQRGFPIGSDRLPPRALLVCNAVRFKSCGLSFCEKQRGFPLSSGRADLCRRLAFRLLQRQNALAVPLVGTIVGRGPVRPVIGAIILFLILVRRRRWRRAMIRAVSVTVMIVAVRRAAAAENRAADQQQAGQNQSQITCHGDLPGYDVLRPSPAWERQ